MAHADPAAELPVALTALGARFRVESKGGRRELRPEQFFLGRLTTALASDELLTVIEVPIPPPASGHAFSEFARRHGDFALGGAAVLVSVEPGGACERASIALLAAGPTPIRAAAAEEWLVGRDLDAQAAGEAARLAMEDVSPSGDIHGSSDFRRGVIEEVVRRALLKARQRARAVGP